MKSAVQSLGYEIVRRVPEEASSFPTDASADDCSILSAIAPFTMTSVDRQLALIHSVRHVVRNRIPGCFLECGVWRGGSAMAIALTLAQEGDRERDVFLFDTFEGMTAPTINDRSFDGASAAMLLAHSHRDENVWCLAGLDDVRANLASTAYPAEKVHFIQGPVEQTIPLDPTPASIALLRLDTDWYESTKHEMLHLFPRLERGGILIVDDYGHWQGARLAVDEYLASVPDAYFLHRIDYTGRLIVKQ